MSKYSRYIQRPSLHTHMFMYIHIYIIAILIRCGPYQVVHPTFPGVYIQFKLHPENIVVLVRSVIPKGEFGDGIPAVEIRCFQSGDHSLMSGSSSYRYGRSF